MEIPDNLKLLYKHWKKHAEHKIKRSNETCDVETEKLEKIAAFANERMLIWERKQKNLSKLTSNPILSKFRFCNIYRELDKQTIQTHELLKPLEKDLELWFLNLLFSRMVCNPTTVKRAGFLSLEHKTNLTVYENLKRLPSPKYGTAYVFPISAILAMGFSDRESFFCNHLPEIVKKAVFKLNSLKEASVIEALTILLPTLKVNLKFHLTECLIDFAYQFPDKIDLFKDFPIGPGALPTLKWLNHQLDPTLLNESLTYLELSNFPYLSYNGNKVPLSSENWEGIFCEFRKYTNLSNGTGRRRLFKP